VAQQLRLLELMALWTRRCAVDPPPKRSAALWTLLRRGGSEEEAQKQTYGIGSTLET